MPYKPHAALAAALAALAVAAPAASAEVTAQPLSIAQSGTDISFTVGMSADVDADVMALLVAPAGSGTTTLAATIGHGGFGVAQVTGSTAACQTLTSSDATLVTDIPDPAFAEDGTSYTWTIPAADLPASFDAKAVIATDPSADGCAPDADNHGVATTLDGAQRFPAPVVVPPVTTPAPAPPPPVVAQPIVAPKPVADPDKDGIKNDWLVGGKALAAPKAVKVLAVTAHGATLTLPKAPKGGTIRVFRRVAGKGRFRAVAVKLSKKTRKATMSGLKARTRYELKVVAVNKAGRQTQASKTVVVKTAKV